MSPLFHRPDDDAEVPVEQFAAQLMTRYFIIDLIVASQLTNMVSVDKVCWDLQPDNTGEHLGEPIPGALVAKLHSGSPA